MSEIQIFDPLDVARRERDEANAKAERSDNLLAMALIDWAEDRAKVATERDEARAHLGDALLERAQLAAQLLQDAPIAAAARAWATWHRQIHTVFYGVERALFDAIPKDELLKLARAK